jgi:hypothetical protein
MTKAEFQDLLDSTCGGSNTHDAQNTSRKNPVNKISERLVSQRQEKEQAFQDLLDSTCGGANTHDAENTSRQNSNNGMFYPNNWL